MRTSFKSKITNPKHLRPSVKTSGVLEIDLSELSLKQRCDLAELLRSHVQADARGRQRTRLRNGAYRQLGEKDVRGRTRDILARIVGIGSGRQLEKLMIVFDYASPELQEAVDVGQVSVHQAWRIVSGRMCCLEKAG